MAAATWRLPSAQGSENADRADREPVKKRGRREELKGRKGAGKSSKEVFRDMAATAGSTPPGTPTGVPAAATPVTRVRRRRRKAASDDDDETTNAGDNEVLNMLPAMLKSNLQISQQVRLLQGVCFRTWMLPQQHPVVKAAKAAGVTYDNAAKAAGPGHQLGPPHCHIAMAVFEALNKSLKEGVAREGSDGAGAVASWTRVFDEVLLKDQRQILRAVMLMTVKDNYSKDDALTKTARISMHINGNAGLLMSAIEGTLGWISAEEKFGPPPRGALERVLETQLRQVQAWRM